MKCSNAINYCLALKRIFLRQTNSKQELKTCDNLEYTRVIQWLTAVYLQSNGKRKLA